MVQQQTRIDFETATRGDQADQQRGQEPLHRREDVDHAAWAVPHQDGTWHLAWDLRGGASHYQLILEGAKGEAPRLIDEGPDLGSLQVPSIAKAHRLRVIARIGDTEYAVAKVGTGKPDAKADIAEHLREWKSWKELASHEPDGTTLLDTKTESTDIFGSPCVFTVQQWQTTRTPQNLLTFKPNLGNLFPGAIVQSRNAIKDGTLTTAQIEDAERAPVSLVISALNSGPSAPVQPTLEATTNAIKAAVQGRRSIASDIRFSMAEAQTSEQTALSLNVSGKYGGFAASLDVESDRKENQSSVVVFLQQRAFNASVQIVSPDDLFSDRFTEARLARLKTLGAMDRDNPPLIVSDVIYGRIIAIRIRSDSSESDLSAAAKASYNGFAEASAEVNGKHRETLAKSDFKVFAQGDEQKVIEAAVSGTLVKYLSEEKDLDAFEPIGFVLKTLDDELATMSESYKYQTIV